MEVVSTSPGPLNVHLWLQCGSMNQWSILNSHVFMITWLTEEQVRMSKSLITAHEARGTITSFSPLTHPGEMAGDPHADHHACSALSEQRETRINPFSHFCSSSCLPLLRVWWWPRTQVRGSAFTTKGRTFASYISTTHWTNIRAQWWRPAVV